MAKTKGPRFRQRHCLRNCTQYVLDISHTLVRFWRCCHFSSRICKSCKTRPVKGEKASDFRSDNVQRRGVGDAAEGQRRIISECGAGAGADCGFVGGFVVCRCRYVTRTGGTEDSSSISRSVKVPCFPTSPSCQSDAFLSCFLTEVRRTIKRSLRIKKLNGERGGVGH